MPQTPITSDGPTMFEFADIFESYWQPIHNYLRRLSENAVQADDLTQEVFVRVYRGLPSFRGDSSLKTWLYQIARNIFFDYTRQAFTRRDRAGLPLESSTGAYDHWPDEKSVRPEQAAEQREMSSCVQDHINSVPDSYRDVLVLHDMQALKNQEIAEVLGISLATVKIRLHRARKKLHESLAAGCDFGRDERGAFVCESKGPDESSDTPRP